VRALALALLLLAAAPAAAGAATASVEPAPQNLVCGKYMICPPDMVVFTAAAGESNDVVVTDDSVGPDRFRFVVRDTGAPVEAGAGCERVDQRTVACTAAIFGTVRLGDGDDWIHSAGGSVLGGDGDDVLAVRFGPSWGEEGDDLLVGLTGYGGGGEDVLVVNAGYGGAGDDALRCSPRESMCQLMGGPGNDALRGGPSMDQLYGEAGRDLLHGRGGDDNLTGGQGDDRLFGGAGNDVLGGGRGADRVDCGAGRRDQAVRDRRDRIIRCEQPAPRR
jgi:Ca2+-binding RTX toxin-like protein